MIQILEIIFLLSLGNIKEIISWLTGIPIGTGLPTLVLAGVIYFYVFWRYRPLSDFAKISFSLRNFGIAIGAGLMLAVPPALFFIFPVVIGNLDYTPIKSLSTEAFLVRVLFEIPFATALSEELLFRQYLYQKFPVTNFQAFWRRKNSPLAGEGNILRIQLKGSVLFFALHGLFFALWHLVVSLHTVLDTNLGEANFILGIISYIGSLLSIFVGGIVFLLVRYWTGSFVFSTITHWLNVALMTTVIWLK